VGAAFAADNVPRFFGAFAFAPLRFFAGTDIGAHLTAACDLLFWLTDRSRLIFSHGEAPGHSILGHLGK
jgi:hypothetical protein